MDLKVEKELFDQIAQQIHSDSSPVGIDAKKTHIIILAKLMELDKRLQDIETKLENLK